MGKSDEKDTGLENIYTKAEKILMASFPQLDGEKIRAAVLAHRGEIPAAYDALMDFQNLLASPDDQTEGQTATENDTTHPPQAVSQRRSLQMRKQKNAILPDKSPPKSTKKHLRLHDGAVSDSSPLAGPSAVGVRSKLVATAPIPDARETREVVIESGSTTAVPVMPKREPLREKLKTWNSIAPGDLNELTQKSSFKDESGPEEQVSEVEIDDNNVESTGPQFYVQYLLGARYHKSMNRVEWKVKWAGYPETEATWEPIKMLYGNGKEVGRENRLLMKFFKAKYGTPDEKRLCIMEKATFSEAKRWETQKIPS